VARGFSFANGLAISADGNSLFVAETGRYRIWKVASHTSDLDVRGASTQARVLLDNLLASRYSRYTRLRFTAHPSRLSRM
jgi:sugar lactone lactonase YvrE